MITFFQFFQDFVIMSKSLCRWSSGHKILPELSFSESEASRCYLMDFGLPDHSDGGIFNYGSIFWSKRTYMILAPKSRFVPDYYSIALRERSISSLQAILFCISPSYAEPAVNRQPGYRWMTRRALGIYSVTRRRLTTHKDTVPTLANCLKIAEHYKNQAFSSSAR